MNIEINTANIEKMLGGLKRSELTPAFKVAFRKAAGVLASAVRNRVRQDYPGGRRANSGVLRGVQYGPLYKDVKMTVYKSGEGANVSLFSRSKPNRWCVLYWLNDGADRTGSKAAYTRKTGGHAPADRGTLPKRDFFAQAVGGAKSRAEQTLVKELPDAIVKQINKNKNS